MKTTQYAAIAACLAFTLSGCGSSGTSEADAGAGTGGQPGYGGGQAGGGQPGGQGGPGGSGSGKVAAVSGSTAQVQNQSGQVAVTWTARTTFAQQVATRAAALKVGDCVVALPAASDQPADGSTDEAASAVTAATVRITAAVDGSCSAGMRPGGGTPPSGAPTGAPGEGDGQGTRGGRPGGLGAFGEVTGISGSGFTVESQAPGGASSDTATTIVVTTSAATTWTTTQKATAKAVKVGRCVTSMGQTGSTGAVAAVSITVSAPVDGACTSGFGGPGAGGPNP